MTVDGGPEAQVERHQLLPGIPDEISLDHITPKLPFKAIRVLSSVSCAWRHAIRTRQVHHARLCTHATETFILVKYFFEFDMVDWLISLYSLRDNLSYELPPVPTLGRGTPEGSDCVFLDGKVYVLGGKFPQGGPDDMKAVFVLDLGGQWQWKQCASMHKGRKDFACAGMDGHIYALGGWFRGQPVCESEVYDPKENKWFFIEPMPSRRTFHYAVTLGEEIFVHSGFTYGPKRSRRRSDKDLNLEVYNPVRGDWRVVQSFQRHRSDTIFLAQGKFHVVNDNGISVYDVDRNLWTNLHSHSLDVMEHVETFSPYAILAVDDEEVVAVMYWFGRKQTSGTCFARCGGLGRKNATIVWETAECSLPLWENPNLYFTFVMYPIQL